MQRNHIWLWVAIGWKCKCKCGENLMLMAGTVSKCDLALKMLEEIRTIYSVVLCLSVYSQLPHGEVCG